MAQTTDLKYEDLNDVQRAFYDGYDAGYKAAIESVGFLCPPITTARLYTPSPEERAVFLRSLEERAVFLRSLFTGEEAAP